MKEFEGKRVLITGGASGIGRAAAERFLTAGASVLVFDCDHKSLDELAAKHPGNPLTIVTVDISDQAAVDAAFRSQPVQPVDILVHCSAFRRLLSPRCQVQIIKIFHYAHSIDWSV